MRADDQDLKCHVEIDNSDDIIFRLELFILPTCIRNLNFYAQ